MRLPSGELAECDEDYMSVFAAHFTKVLNNQKKTDNEVVNIIWLREVMSELDDKPTWDEFMTAVVEITNDKATGLTTYLLMHSRRWTKTAYFTTSIL